MSQILIQQKQRGAILILSLVLLAAITIIGIAVYEVSIADRKIVNNILNLNQATIGNDIAKDVAIGWLDSLKARPPSCGDISCCNSQGALSTAGSGCATITCPTSCIWKRGSFNPSPSQQDDNWWTEYGIFVDSVAGYQNVSWRPQYIIEEMDCDDANKVRTYRITTRSMGKSQPAGSNTPPIIVQEHIVQTTTPSIIQTAFDYSCHSTGTVAAGGGIGYPEMTNNIYPTSILTAYDGYISGLWLSQSSPNANVNMTITLSVGSRSITYYNQVLVPPSPCNPKDTVPRGKMGYTAIPRTFRVKDNYTIKIKPVEYILIDLVSSIGVSPTAPMRLTIDGSPGFCEDPKPRPAKFWCP